MGNNTIVFRAIQMMEKYISDHYSNEDKKTALELLSDIHMQAFIRNLEDYC